MKLVRFGEVGGERPGLIDSQGRIRDLSSLVPDHCGWHLHPRQLAWLAEVVASRLDSLPIVPASTRLGCPVGSVGKIVGIGLNYRDHAQECGAPIPTSPIVFLKPTGTLGGPTDDVALPPGSVCTDWEVELAVVIGSRAKHVDREHALQHVAGYCVANDLSERHDQLELGSQWTKGKSHDGFCPLGPWLVTPDEVGDPQSLSLWCEVNGKRVQDSHTSNMIFGVAHCIADVSRYMTLEPGDILITGTPAGVGLGQKPPRYLAQGDIVTLGIERLGTQRQSLRDAR